MVEKLINRDFMISLGIIGQIVQHNIIQVHLALFNKNHDGEGRKLFRY